MSYLHRSAARKRLASVLAVAFVAAALIAGACDDDGDGAPGQPTVPPAVGSPVPTLAPQTELEAKLRELESLLQVANGEHYAFGCVYLVNFEQRGETTDTIAAQLPVPVNPPPAWTIGETQLEAPPYLVTVYASDSGPNEVQRFQREYRDARVCLVPVAPTAAATPTP